MPDPRAHLPLHRHRWVSVVCTVHVRYGTFHYTEDHKPHFVAVPYGNRTFNSTPNGSYLRHHTQ